MSPIVWLIITVVLGLAEASTPVLVCLWFCLGAAVTFVISFFVDNLIAQIVIYVIVSVLGLLAIRPFIKKSSESKERDAVTNYDEYIGREVSVFQSIPAGGTGRVKLAGISWLARCADGAALESGSRVRVVAVESTVLVVEPAVPAPEPAGSVAL